MPHFIKDKFLGKKYYGKFNAIVIFCDISGFTALTEEFLKQGKSGSEALTDILLNVFDPMVNSIYSHSGFIATFGGDAFTALFSYKNQKEANKIIEHAITAIKEILLFFKEKGDIETIYGNFNLNVKIGCAEGIVHWGIIGEKNKRNVSQAHQYYFYGNAIDRAAELEHRTEKGFYTVSEELSYYKNIQNIPKISIKNNLTSIPSGIIKQFFPKEFDNWTGGELRRVTTIFLPFNCELKYSFLNKIFIITNNLVIKYGGFLSRLSSGDKGTFFLIFFGFPVSYEDDIKRALSFCEEFKIKVKQLHFKFKMGISYGLSYAGVSGGEKRAELTCQGDVVNFAARLAFAGDYGHIFLSKEVATRSEFFAKTKFAFYKKFKGKKGKLPVYTFTNLKKNLSVKKYKLPLIGRENELKILQSWFKDSIFKGKFGGINYIYGDPGVGKSRLIYGLKEWLDNGKNKYNWIFLPCDGLVLRPFEGIKTFLRSYFDIKENSKKNKSKFIKKIKELCGDKRINKTSRSELWRTRSIIGAELGLFWKGSLYSKLDSKLKYQNLIQALKEFFKALSNQKPTILIVEDGQWLDESTEKFLIPLTREVNKFPFILIIPSRYQKNNKKLKFKVAKDCIEREFELKPLKQGLEEKFANIIFGKGKLENNLKSLIIEKSSGNPFYIEQWLYHLKDLVKFTNNKWMLLNKRFDLPDNIDQVIIARIDSLGNKVKNMLQHASVLGKRFSIKILSEMLYDKGNIFQNLNKAEKAQVILPENSVLTYIELIYLFKHILFRDVAYQMQLEKQRIALHKLAFELIEKLFKNNIEFWYDDLCFHSEKGLLKQKLKFYLMKAGDYYNENYINDKAISNYIKLINMNIPEDEKVKLYIKLNNIYEKTGPYSKGEECAKKALTISKKINNKKLIADSIVSLANILHYRGKNDEAVEYLKKSFDIYRELKDTGSEAKSLQTIGKILVHKSDFNRSLENFKKVLEIFKRIKNYKGVISVKLNIAQNCIYLNKLKEAKKFLDSAFKLIKKHNIQDKISESVILKGTFYWKLNDFEKSLKYYKESLGLLIKVGDKSQTTNVLNNIGGLCFVRSQHKQALSYFNRSLSISREIGAVRSEGRTIYNIGEVYYSLHKYKKAIKHYEDYIDCAKFIGSIGAEGASLERISEIFTVLGEYEESLKLKKKLIPIGKKLENFEGQCEAILKVGLNYLYLKKYELSEKYFNKAYNLSKEIDDNKSIICSLSYLTKLYIKTNRKRNIEKYYKLLNITDSSKEDSLTKALKLCVQGEYEFINGNIDEKYFEDAIKLYKKYSSLFGEKQNIADALLDYALNLLKYNQKSNLIKIKKLLKEAKDLNLKMGRVHKLKEIELLLKKIK